MTKLRNRANIKQTRFSLFFVYCDTDSDRTTNHHYTEKLTAIYGGELFDPSFDPNGNRSGRKQRDRKDRTHGLTQRKAPYGAEIAGKHTCRAPHNPKVVGSNPSSATISSGCNWFQLHPLHFISLFVFACVAFAFENLSADMCSLLFSYLGFILSVLGYVGGSSMDVNVVVVVGCNKVGSNNMRGQKQ